MHKERKKCLFRYTYDISLITSNKREAHPKKRRLHTCYLYLFIYINTRYLLKNFLKKSN